MLKRKLAYSGRFCLSCRTTATRITRSAAAKVKLAMFIIKNLAKSILDSVLYTNTILGLTNFLMPAAIAVASYNLMRPQGSQTILILKLDIAIDIVPDEPKA